MLKLERRNFFPGGSNEEIGVKASHDPIYINELVLVELPCPTDRTYHCVTPQYPVT